jgi:DNA-binding XRE family transcriptional regulator
MVLVEFLQQKIWEYKKAHPRYSSSQIAKLWGLSTSSLNRIENLETKKPSLEQAIRILKGVGRKHQIFETLGEFYPELKEVFLSQIDVQNHSSTAFRKNTYLDQEEDR